MKKLLAAAVLAISFNAFAETALKGTDNLPAEIFIPKGASFVEGSDDGSGGFDLTLNSSDKIADLAAAIQANAKEKGLVELEADVQEDSAKIEVAKLGENNDPQAPEARVEYSLSSDDGKTTIEILYLK